MSREMDVVPSTSAEPDQEEPQAPFDKNYLSRVYNAIREGIILAADKKNVNLSFDYNLEILGSLVLTLLWKPTQTFTTKYHVISELNGVLQKDDFVPDYTKLKAWAELTNATLEPKKLYPVLFLVQLAVKAKEEMLYHKNSISKELGLPGWTEIYAEGKTIANKLKKSRNLSVGPLVHIASLKKLQNLTNQEKSRLSDTALNNIKKRHIDALKRQLISESQRAIIEEFTNNQWDHLPLLVASMAVIKPHIEHHYVLTPPLIVHCGDLSGADMTTHWILKKVAEAVPKIVKICPPRWSEPLNQMLIHQVFGTWKENLAVMDWAFKTDFEERAKWGSPADLKDLSKCEKLPYRFQVDYFSKPQRGAPRNIGPAQSQQLSNTVVMRGKRKAIDHFSDPEEIVKRMKPSGSSLIQRMQAEFKLYQGLETEGTGEWQHINVNSGLPDRSVVCQVNGVKYFFGTPSA